MILTIVLLAILTFSAVSAHDDLAASNNDDAISSSQKTIQLDSNNNENLASDNDQSIYVSNDGSDSASGNQNSPYATINKAILDVNASKNATIYLDEGIFTGENNTDLSINLSHQTNGGSLSIIGKGNGKTVIDANYEAPIFKSISADSVIYLINITFTHGKNSNGAAIANGGLLTIDSCEFISNEATTYGTVYQTANNNLTILNSKFANNKANNGADIYFSRQNYLLTLIGNEFENSTATGSWAIASSVDMENGMSVIRKNTFKNMPVTNLAVLAVRYNNNENIGNITGNTFDNCSHTGSYGILFIQNSYILENSFVNCIADNGYIYINTDFNAYVTFENSTINGTSFTLKAKITDDKGNNVRNAKVQFYIDDEKVGEGSSTNGTVSITINKLLENGNHVLSGNSESSSWSPNPFEVTVKNASVTVDFDQSPIDLWISPEGNDSDGNGSADNPFKTIKHAIDYGLENHIDVIVHLLNGLYNETGDFALSYSNVAKITLVGESKENTVISGNTNSVFLTSGEHTEILLKNLTIKDLAGTNSFTLRYATFEDCIVDNVKTLRANTNPSHIVLRKVQWTNSANLMMYNGEIYDSHFENITSSGTGNFWLATSNNNDEIIVMNSEFINLTCTGGSGSGVFYVQGNFRSINNLFDNNKATKDYGVMYVSGNQIISINDTFTNNHADGNYGVAIFYPNRENASCVIEGGKFINNTAGGNGGAIGIYGGELINCLFENNTASNLGGAIYTPTHSNSISLYKLTLNDVIFKNNNASNGKDIFIAPSTSASQLSSELPGITVAFNDLSTKTLQDTVSVNITHESGAIIGGGNITFTLNGSYMGVGSVIDGKASLDYLGFTQDGSFVLSGDYDIACSDTKFINSTVSVALNPLKDNVTLYVSVDGDDSIADGSLEKPFKTIYAALNSGYKQSKVIVIRVLEGTHYGEGNINLTIFGSLDISIIGDGINKTVITGNASKLTWFIKLLSGGNGELKLSNMTISEINFNYKASNTQTSPIVTEEGTVLKIDSVEFRKNAGNNGGVIYNEGELEITNSRFFNNGDSNQGASLYNKGKATVDNSEFIANHAKSYGDFYNSGELFIYNSLIQDSMRVNGWSGNAFAIGGSGNFTIVNSTISRSGKNASELLEDGDTYANNPAIIISIAVSGNVLLDNVTIDGNNNSYTGPSVAVGANVGVTSTSGSLTYAPASLVVINSKFLNLNAAFSNQKNASVTGSYFKNMTNIYTGTSFAGNMTISDSYFADENVTLTKHTDSIIDLNNNWWANNEKPIYKVSNNDTTPETWLILTLNTTENGQIVLAFKSFDGENITDYDGELYAREFAIDSANATLDINKGTIKNSVVIPINVSASEFYVNASVDGHEVNMTRLIPDISATAAPVYIGSDVVVVITNPDDLLNNITVIIDNKEYSSEVTGNTTYITIPNLVAGNYTASVVYKGDDTYFTKSVPLDVKVLDVIIKAENVEKFYRGPQKLNITVVDSDGKLLTHETITVKIANETVEVTTDENGEALVDLDMAVGSYVGEITLNRTNENVSVIIKSSISVSSNQSVINGDNGFEAKLVDGEGSALVNTNVTFTVDGKQITKTTNANGVAKLTKAEIGAEGMQHKITVINPVNNESVSYVVSLSKTTPAKPSVKPVVTQKIVLKAAKKTVKIKRSAKKLVIKATLKINGKNVKGKIIKFNFKGKTYKAKTNKNGVAQVIIKKNIIKKLKKGKSYTAKITYSKKVAKTIVKVVK